MSRKKINYTKKAVRSVGIVFFVSLISAFIAYLIRFVLAKNLSVEDYGLFYAVLSIILLVVLIEKLGLDEALTKFIAEFRARKKKSLIKSSIISIFFITSAMSILLTIVLIMSSNFLAVNYFHNPKAQILIILLAVFLIFRQVTFLIKGIFRGFGDMANYSLLDMTRNVLILLICFIGFLFTKSILVPAFAYLLSSIFLIIIFIPLIFKIFPEFKEIRLRYSRPLILRLLKFGMPMILGSACLFILEYIDTIMLTYFSGLRSVGLYNVAYPLASILSYFGVAVATVVFPFASELWAMRYKDKLQAGVNLIYRYAFIIMWPFSVIMFAFPELVLSVFFGAKYLEASAPLKILSIGMLFLALANINGQIISGIGKPKTFTKIIVISSLLNVILNLILVPLYDILGASIATSLSFFFMFVLTSRKTGHFLKIKLPFAYWLKNLIAAVIFVLVIGILKNMLVMNIWLETFITLTISLFVYILLIFKFKLITYKEIKMITNKI